MTNWKVIEGAIKVLEVEEVAVDSSEYARREETKSGATNLGLAALKLVSGEFITTYSTSRAPSEVCYDRYWFEVGGFKLYFDLLVTDQARKPPLPREFSTATRARAIAAEEGGLLRAAAIILPEEDVFFWCSYSKAGRGALLRRYLRGIGCIGLVWATLLAMSGGLWQLMSSDGAEWAWLGVFFVAGLALTTVGAVLMLWEDWRSTAETEEVLRIVGFHRPSSVYLDDRVVRRHSWKSDSGGIDFMYQMPT